MNENKPTQVFDIRKSRVSSQVERLFKNADIPTNFVPKTHWEELEQLYQTIGNGLITVSRELNDSIVFLNQLPSDIVNKEHLTVLANGISSDINAFVNRLATNHEKHKNFTGEIIDPSDHVLSLDIFNEYVLIDEQFRNIIVPNAISITEELGKADSLIKAAKKAKEEQAKTTTQEETKEGNTDDAAG